MILNKSKKIPDDRRFVAQVLTVKVCFWFLQKTVITLQHLDFFLIMLYLFQHNSLHTYSLKLCEQLLMHLLLPIPQGGQHRALESEMEYPFSGGRQLQSTTCHYTGSVRSQTCHLVDIHVSPIDYPPLYIYYCKCTVLCELHSCPGNMFSSSPYFLICLKIWVLFKRWSKVCVASAWKRLKSLKAACLSLSIRPSVCNK